MPNEIVFIPSYPVEIDAGIARFCSILFDVGLNNTASILDHPNLATEVVAGFSAPDADAVCDNGLASIGAEAVGIQKLVPLPKPAALRTARRQRIRPLLSGER